MYPTLEDCINDLEKNGRLIRIKEEVDPHLELASIHMRVNAAGGPALLFENVKGSKYRAVSNLFGDLERSEFIFRNTLETTQRLISLRSNPVAALKQPIKNFSSGVAGSKALPMKKKEKEVDGFDEIRIEDLPLIKHWPDDGGAFVTLPQVYSEDPEKPGIMNSNLGMYRVQLDGNDFETNKEIGMHYQIHRGIGGIRKKPTASGQPLK